MKRRQATKNEYDEIIEIWEASVRVTHDFLKESDIEEIRKDVISYLPVLTIDLWIDKEEIIGFSCVEDGHLEMLFLKPSNIGKGYGKKIMARLLEEYEIHSVDVNKDNERAKQFYIRNGFKVYKESPKDGEGREYPILHMKLYK